MAAPDITNPYAAPSDISGPTTGPSHLWQVEGIGLLVAHGAVLPKVDLESGSEEASLVEVTRKFTKAHWSMGFMGLGPMMFLIVPRLLKKWDTIPSGVSFGIAVMILSVAWLAVYLLILLPLTLRLSFTTYVHPATEARRKRNTNIRGVLYFLSFTILISPLGFVFANSNILQSAGLFGILLLGFISVIAVSLWRYQDRPKIRMALESNGWLRLTGVHFNAIRRLEDWRTEQQEAP